MRENIRLDKIKIGGLLLSMLFCCQAIKAEELQISGNKRTKTSYIEKLVGICNKDIVRGRYANLFTREEQLRQCLINSRLFSQVTVVEGSIDTRQNTTSVIVKDRWSFLGFPSYQSGVEDNEAAWGLFLFDSNIAGSGNILAFSYRRQISDEQDSYSLFSGIPYLDKNGNYGLFVGAQDISAINYQYNNEDWIYRNSEYFKSFFIKLDQYITSRFELSYSYSLRDYLSNDNLLRQSGIVTKDELADFNSHSLELGYGWNNLDREYYYQKGFEFSQALEGKFNAESGHRIDNTFKTDIYWGLPTTKGQILQLNFAASGRDKQDAYDSLKIGGDIGSRAIPNRGAWAQQYSTLGLDYQIPIIATSSIFWTIGAFADAGYLWDIPNSAKLPQDELGYTAGGFVTYLYPRQVSVPALGFSYGSNSRFQERAFSFFIGGTGGP